MVITIVSAAEFSAFVPNAATAVLRIYDPVDDWEADSVAQAAAGWGRYTGLAFWDVGFAGLSLAERALIRLLGRHRSLCLTLGQKLFGDEIPWRPFLPADALDIHGFADGLASAGVQNLMVVCSNGRSRGTTVGTWIARYLGLDRPAQRGWQRESDTIAAILARVCPARQKRPAGVPTLATFAH